MSQQIRDQLQTTLGSAYTLDRELGGGGMSRVFVAEEHRLKRKVVVKVLSPELAQGISVERFEREIQTAAALQQANIVPVLSAGETNGLPFYTMPFVEGESLRARLGRGPLSITEVISVMRDVSKALAYAHRQGVVHRDIKPDNVLLSEGTAVVTDFGIAKAISAARTSSGQATLTQVGTSIGTPAYMAPEQAAGDPDIDQRADIYSLGAMAYELLAGQAVFAGRTPQRMLAAHMAETPKPVTDLRPDTPGALAELVMGCLEKDAAKRPVSATEITRVLEQITSGSGMQAMPAVLIGGSGMFRKALAIYAAAFVAVGVLARAAILVIGLPEWVFPGALIVMALGLPVILWTGYVQRVVRRSVTTTPTFTPGGTPSLQHGTIATMALKAAPHVSWSRTARRGAYAMATFVFIIAAFMVMRALGIGPVGSLLASGALKQNDVILLDDFTVSGSDTTLGRVVSDAVRAGLAPARVFSVMPAREVGDALRRIERPASSKLDLPLAQEIARRNGVKAIVDGDVASVAGTYILTVRLVSVDSARELTSVRATAASVDGLIDAADKVARSILSKAGESLKRVNAAPPLARVTTASFEALRKYSEAARANDMASNPAVAIPLLREAVAIDTMFAEGWRKLAIAMANQGLPRASIDSAYDHAFALRRRLDENTADRIEGSYYMQGSHGNRALAIAAYERMLARGDSSLASNLSSLYRSKGQFAKAESLMAADARTPRAGLVVLENLASSYLAQEKWASYDSLVSRVRREHPEATNFAFLYQDGLRGRGRIAALDRYADSVLKAGHKQYPSAPYWWLADLAYQRGQLRKQAEYEREIVRLDSIGGSPRLAIDAPIRLLRRRGDLRLATADDVRVLDAALARYPVDREPRANRPYFDLVSAYASAERPDRARYWLDQWLRAYGDTTAMGRDVSTYRIGQAIVAMSEGRALESAALLRKALVLPDGQAFNCGECPIWFAGMFARHGLADSAVARFAQYQQTPAGRRKRDGWNLDYGVDFIENMARAYEQVGDTTHAAQMYADMIDRWKNADAELQPRVTAAREKLRRMSLDAPRR